MRVAGLFSVVSTVLWLTNDSHKPDTTFNKFMFVIAITGLFFGLLSIAMSFRSKYK